MRVVVAEDETILREGLCSLLAQEGFNVVAQVDTAEALLDVVREKRPDLALVDIRMPPRHSTEGIDAAKVIQQEFPSTAILVLSAYIDAHHAKELLRNGHPVGYLLKSRVSSKGVLLDAIRRVGDGESVLDSTFVQELAAGARHNDPLETLTPREREVLMLMAEGLSNAGIARRLVLAETTVEKHIGSILAKLNLLDGADHHRRVCAVIRYLETR
ncbi:response regulator [Mycolicibacterium goodii]|uniref:Response regulator transcription factor n=1 Tax=Mycolicibacterium goodii TaxID=134601 RepID=A0ABS6HXL8_MYCGD|nr:response regulator transcription factor [Mycolicibacterium goodii]OKH62964.1 LuxR family transcriptional regulator [Mycobacterium sp. SWH-M5]MBU8813145.1 response regulator transcription factor [Mycolicibacterium goodii]MBU8816701.1 response regulator transcription factor [Mycolicibacterium goodii]MBU8826265.1 response regulator transcription factor [Mycolicibacterium goodii]MBU8828847.1 response regulator transcription factor [Mycolicibacterium goodii]